MEDRQYLELELQKLKNRRKEGITKRNIYLAEYEILYKELTNQIDSIESHLDKNLLK